MCPFQLAACYSPLTFELPDPWLWFSEQQVQWPGGNCCFPACTWEIFFGNLGGVIDVRGFLGQAHVALPFCVTIGP